MGLALQLALVASLCAQVCWAEGVRLSLSLEEAERMAVEHHPQVRAMEELLAKAREGRLEAVSKWLPELTALSEGFKTQQPQEPIIDSTTSFMTQLTVTQALFSMDDYYDVKIAALVERQLELLLDAAMNDALFLARSLYYRLLLDDDHKATAQEQVDLFSSLAVEMARRYQVGEAILYNVNQSKVAVSNALNRYYAAVKQYKVDVDRLLQALGVDPSGQEVVLTEQAIPLYAVAELAEKLQAEERMFQEIPQMGSHRLYTEEEIAVWEERAEQYRPDLKISDNRMQIAAAGIKKRQGEYLPEVDLVGNYGGEPSPFAFNPSKRIDDQQFHWGVGVVLNWTLFDGGGREHRIKEAKAQWRADRHQYQKSLQEAHAAVRREIYGLEEAIAGTVNAGANVRLAEQTVEQVRQQLDVGYVTIFDYQAAVDSLIQAKYAYHQARYDVIVHYYGLRHASGVDIR
jgi:outer membrane protein TolC